MPKFPAFDARQVDRRIRLAMRIFELEQTSVPSLGDVADRVGLSRFRLAHLFREQVGESCTAYSRRIRLENSVNQILHDSVDLSAVAATFGYASQAAFTRAFSRHFGISPQRYSEDVAGLAERHGANGHLAPVGGSTHGQTLLKTPVILVEQPPSIALARRFYGHDLAGHWQRFLSGFPAMSLASGSQLVGLSYDNAKVTPVERWRYDCSVVLPNSVMMRDALPPGIDQVEIPGGIHAEVAVDGEWLDVWKATIGLFTEWLPNRPDLRPEGDPIPHWLDSLPESLPLKARATIRVRHWGDAPAYNMRPFSRRGIVAGTRTVA